jgi:peptidoglycan/LPS O-acetylase OafA/YrhL
MELQKDYIDNLETISANPILKPEYRSITEDPVPDISGDGGKADIDPDKKTVAVPKGEGYSQALDGVRFLAFMAVFLEHTRYGPYLQFGTTGVMVFFVLSGFLIGRILLSTREKPNTTLFTKLKVFYIRRSLRIFPLYYLVLLFIAALPQFGIAIGGARIHLPWSFFYLTNLEVFFRRAWFPPQSHFWSLSVEEHFYIVVPLAILLMSRKHFGRMMIVLFLLIGSARFINAVTLKDSFIKTLSPMNFDYLAWGILAAILEKRRQFINLSVRSFYICGQFAMILTGLLVLLSFCHVKAAWFELVMACGFPVALGIGVAALVLGLWENKYRLPATVLSFQPLAYFGKISYGLYVYHYFIMNAILYPYHRSDALTYSILCIVTLAVTLATASLSWHLFEHPMNKLKERFAY